MALADVSRYRVWARSLLSPRGRLLPGIGARLHGHPRLVAGLLVAARRTPAGRIRAAAYRGVSQPLIRRFGSPLEVPVSGGSRLRVDPEDYVGRTLALTGIWEPQVTAAFRALLRRGDVCVDVGANIGYFTLLAARLVGPVGRVYAVEPSPRTHAALRANVALNGLTNVVALHVAAGDVEEARVLYEGPPGDRGGASLHHAKARGGEAVTVETRRLDALLAHELAPIRLVKVDVEGAELEVLRGLEGVYARGGRPAVILEVSPEWSGEDAAEQLLDFCAAHGLDAFRLPRESPLDGRGEAVFAPVAVTRVEDEQEEWLLAPRQ